MIIIFVSDDYDFVDTNMFAEVSGQLFNVDLNSTHEGVVKIRN